MQTQPNTETLTPSGATQQPLLDRSQLQVGAFITGPAWGTMRRIEEIDGNTIVLVKIPATPLSIQRGHLHALVLHANSECACGYRRELITGVLPLRDGLARTYILLPTGPLVVPDPLTVYVGPGGRMFRPSAVGQWSSALPLIPQLEPFWTLPQPLRAILGRE